MENTATIRIDVEKVVKSKTSRRVPRFVIRYLERIVHQDEINQFFVDHKGVEGLDFMEQTLDYLGVKVVVKGEENIPSDGEYIFACNHPLGGLDGMALGTIVGRHYNGNVKYLVTEFLMNMKPLAPLFIPINKTGGLQSRDLNSSIERIFDQHQQFLVFPAGVCSRLVDGKVQDLVWKKTFISKAIEHQRDVVPVYFEARNSRFFYNLSRIRTALGIKFNIEQLYLADEMFKQRGNTFTVTFGKPIPYTTFDASQSPFKWAQYVREVVYSLKNQDK